jgi:hypothetical protein
VTPESVRESYQRALAAHRRAVELHEEAARLHERAGAVEMAGIERADARVEGERLKEAEALHPDWA